MTEEQVNALIKAAVKTERKLIKEAISRTYMRTHSTDSAEDMLVKLERAYDEVVEEAIKNVR